VVDTINTQKISAKIFDYHISLKHKGKRIIAVKTTIMIKNSGGTPTPSRKKRREKNEYPIMNIQKNEKRRR
jgi:hypothetical protein